MKIVRFIYDGKVYSGNAFEKVVVGFSDKGTESTFKIDDVTFLPPVEPSKIVCVGLNYRDHAAELGMPIPQEPIIFLKPPSAVIGPEDKILCPVNSDRVDYEAELAVVIKKEARDVNVAMAEEYVLGYTCFNDVTARDLQKKDGQWTRAKSFDTFAPIGPWVETELDPADLSVRTFLNGELRQDSRTSEFIFNVAELIAFVSSVMTLFPGDVITTGTPSGIGPMRSGDKVIVEIEGIGRLINYVE